jgi:hypothetical protein
VHSEGPAAMPEEIDSPTEDLRRVAEITFQKRVSKVYDPVLRETKDLAEKFANEGIASAGNYQCKVADKVFAKFESIEATLEEIFIDQRYAQNLPTVAGLDGIKGWRLNVPPPPN